MQLLRFVIFLPLILATKLAHPEDLIDDLINGFKNAVDCASCHALLVPLKLLAELGDAAFVPALVAACKVFKLEDDDVCTGAITEQGPILAHVLRSISPFKQTATKLCAGTLGLCQSPAVNQYKFPLPERKRAAAPISSTGRTPFQVVHFSDVHIDREYVAGSDANCKKPICCRNFANSAVPPSQPAGPFGSHSCDSPVALVKSMLQETSVFAQAAFSIFTGDVPAAAVWLVNKTGVTNDLEQFNEELGEMLDAPVFPAIVNNFPREDNVGSFNAQWVFDLEGKQWAQWTNSTAADEETHFSGSYAVTAPGTNLRIISLNTVYWYKLNFWLYDSDTPEPDPRGILAFLVTQLQAAEDASQRAWIIGHMPPGSVDTLNDQSNYYDQIVQRYKDTIAAQFFGHTHRDEFEVAYSDYGDRSRETAVSVAWIAPALTPRSGNPGFKVYDIDPDTYEIMDAKVYFVDLANPNYQIKPEWSLYYSARAQYAPLIIPDWPPTAPLNASFWHAVTEAFEADDAAFQRYNEIVTRGAPNVAPCDAACKAALICQMRAARAEDNCYVPKLLTKPMRRATEEATEMRSGLPEDQCEGAGLGYLLSQLALKVAPGVALEEPMDELRRALRKIIR
ncbi:sphingomyelin phosphodiesterase [Mycena filopes]|nr:sphingomyelin phosphodiesterase [Mycena filopes]